MKKLVHITLLGAILILAATNCWGQDDSPHVKFDAKVTSVEDQGAKLNVVKIQVSAEGIIIDSLITQNGRLFYQLDTGKVYKIEFSKSGYISKHLVVSTKDAPEDVKKNTKLKVEVSLFKAKKGLQVGFLKTKPMGVARYNYTNGKLEWDKDYTRGIVEQIITATLDRYNEENPDD